MDDQPADDIRRREDLLAMGVGDPDADAPAADLPGAPGSPAHALASDLASEAEEIRRLVDAGAGSPEELRELAARLREHRAREESLWRENVKPALVKENKGRFRGHVSIPKEPKVTSSQSVVVIGLTIVALLIIVVVAANTSGLLLIVPFVGLLVWAWKHGRDAMR